eukprot:c15788_g1_i1.p1 GENE.c15788_g1_i1~~c15788_g1_i1.p1  ORF type:complete len:393 (-),score=95.20 c15788_g1_i1:51-1187(-)
MGSWWSRPQAPSISPEAAKRNTRARIIDEFCDTYMDFQSAGDPTRLHPTLAIKQMPIVAGPSKLSQPERVVCIGDIHGDLEKCKNAFQIAGLTDHTHRWIGKNTMCIQVGDLLDRGEDEIQVLYFIERLKHEARQAGGALHVINGNHETMNINSQFRYATPKSMSKYKNWLTWYNTFQNVKRKCGVASAPPPLPLFQLMPRLNGDTGTVARHLAFKPGGPLTARFFANQHMVMMVGDNVFVHAGLLPHHVAAGWSTVHEINVQSAKWMKGEIAMPRDLQGKNAIVWSRKFSNPDEACDCRTLASVLDTIGAKSMIVGHSIQDRINSACDGRVIRIDVGMSKGCSNSAPQVLEIVNNKLRILTRNEQQQQTQKRQAHKN